MRPQHGVDTDKLNLTLDGVSVLIGRRAEIDWGLLRGHPEFVQTVLDEFGEPRWSADEDSFTLVVEAGDPVIGETVVELAAGEAVRYAFHAEQTSSLKQPVPFAERWVIGRADCITLQLAGSAKHPVIVRLYAGDYRPGLPWQMSIRKDPELLEESRAYWSTHAYLAGSSPAIGRLTDRPPLWATDFQAFLRRDEWRRAESHTVTTRR